MNLEPVVHYQYGMTMTNYSPWDQAALAFDASPHLMAIPNLMVDPSSFPSATSPMMPPSPAYMPSPTHHDFYSPSMSPPAPTTVSSPIASSLPLSPISMKSPDGPQIRLNPLVMKPNLSHSLPVTTPFKKYVISSGSVSRNDTDTNFSSPYNQAHFLNQDFEPIHWEPNESRK
jgi:ubiquitin thioesterase protein OTUB1